MAIQGETFSTVASGVTETAYLAEDLSFGNTYEFKIESRNANGFSAYSDTLALLCAYKPDPPLSLSTANSADLVTVSWSLPVANGYPVHAYKILVQEKASGFYTQESTDCDGTSAEVVAGRECTIALATLRATPYNLEKGDSVNVKVISVNKFGDSKRSSLGAGAVI